MTKRIRTDYNKNYYQKHKDQAKKYHRKYYHENKDQIKKLQKNYRKTNLGRALCLLASAKERAKRKGITFELDKKWILKKLGKGLCELSSLKFCYKHVKNGNITNPYAPSIDRKNSKKGYTKRNTQIILWCVNNAKSTWSIPDWKKVIEAIRRIK